MKKEEIIQTFTRKVQMEEVKMTKLPSQHIKDELMMTRVTYEKRRIFPNNINV
jgi:hypothetical protein